MILKKKKEKGITELELIFTVSPFTDTQPAV